MSEATINNDDGTDEKKSAVTANDSHYKCWNMDVLMWLVILVFMLVGLTACTFIGLYLLTSVRWQEHDFIRKSVRFGAAVFQFLLFPCASCVVKMELYYMDEDRSSDRFWCIVLCILWPKVQSHPMQPSRANGEDQNLCQEEVLLQSNENLYANLKYKVRRYWSYGIITMVFMG